MHRRIVSGMADPIADSRVAGITPHRRIVKIHHSIVYGILQAYIVPKWDAGLSMIKQVVKITPII